MKYKRTLTRLMRLGLRLAARGTTGRTFAFRDRPRSGPGRQPAVSAARPVACSRCLRGYTGTLPRSLIRLGQAGPRMAHPFSRGRRTSAHSSTGCASRETDHSAVERTQPNAVPPQGGEAEASCDAAQSFPRLKTWDTGGSFIRRRKLENLAHPTNLGSLVKQGDARRPEAAFPRVRAAPDRPVETDPS
jgi:hypothetical protein